MYTDHDFTHYGLYWWVNIISFYAALKTTAICYLFFFPPVLFDFPPVLLKFLDLLPDLTLATSLPFNHSTPGLYLPTWPSRWKPFSILLSFQKPWFLWYDIKLTYMQMSQAKLSIICEQYKKCTFITFILGVPSSIQQTYIIFVCALSKKIVNKFRWYTSNIVMSVQHSCMHQFWRNWVFPGQRKIVAYAFGTYNFLQNLTNSHKPPPLLVSHIDSQIITTFYMYVQECWTDGHIQGVIVKRKQGQTCPFLLNLTSIWIILCIIC